MADIASDGPFSAFPGVDRWFAVVTGAGVVLTIDGRESVVTAGHPPVRFDGGVPAGCRLIEGPTRDLNLMLKESGGVMREVRRDEEWRDAFTMRGLFSAVAGRWSALGETRSMGAHELLWDDTGTAADWRFETNDRQAGPPGWWLGFTP